MNHKSTPKNTSVCVRMCDTHRLTLLHKASSLFHTFLLSGGPFLQGFYSEPPLFPRNFHDSIKQCIKLRRAEPKREKGRVSVLDTLRLNAMLSDVSMKFKAIALTLLLLNERGSELNSELLWILSCR